MKQGWEIKRLGEIGTFQRGGGFLKSDYVEDGFPCIHYGQIHTRFGVKTLSHLTCIPKQLALSKSKIAHKGDIVIAITSEDVEGSCKCTAWMGDYDVAVGGHAAIFRHNLNPAFVAYYFRGAYFQTAKTVFAHGSKVVEIKPNDIATIKIAYPSLPEQEKIVAELDCLSGIIEKKKQQLKEYDALAHSIFYEMFGNPIDNEKGWEMCTIDSLCSSIVRGPFGSTLKKEYFIEPTQTAYKVYEQKHAIQKNAEIGTYYISAERFATLSRFEVKAGDIIMSCSGTIGELFEIPIGAEKGLMNQALLKFTLNNRIEKIYFLFAMECVKDSFDRKGTGLQNIGSVGTIKKTQISLPQTSLQQEFASKIEAIEKQKELIKQSIAETETLFNSRMDYYFN